MPLPDFIIIGAAKSGTTSLQEYLAQHPETFFPTSKEPNYFALANRKLPLPGPVSPKVLQALIYSRSYTDFNDYQSIFKNAKEGEKKGEASVRYLYFAGASKLIKETIPDVKLVVVLRDPVSRLYSHYCMNRQYQLETLDVLDAIAAEPERIAKGWGWDWHYTGLGMYEKQLRRYYDLFPKEQIKVLLYDDFVDKPVETTQEICEFIGVSSEFIPDMSKRGKVAYRGRHKALDRWLHWPSKSRRALHKVIPPEIMQPALQRIREWNSAPIPKLDVGMRQEIAKHFEKDIEKLSDLLDREIPWDYQ
ncbi:MAG: sulfotransferase family protein [Akkermansiaceae bacterium]